jgi:hypothetical protein
VRSPDPGDDAHHGEEHDHHMATTARSRPPEETLRRVLAASGLLLLIFSPLIGIVRGRILRFRMHTTGMRSRSRLWLENPGSGTATVGELLLDAAETR